MSHPRSGESCDLRGTDRAALTAWLTARGWQRPVTTLFRGGHLNAATVTTLFHGRATFLDLLVGDVDTFHHRARADGRAGAPGVAAFLDHLGDTA